MLTNSSFTLPSTLTINNDKYRCEKIRLETFNDWPLDFIDKNVLARIGMYFTKVRDIVKCYFCEVEIGLWEHTDDPVNEHNKFSTRCPLMKNCPTNNEPIDVELLQQTLQQQLQSQYLSNVRPLAYPEGSISMPNKSNLYLYTNIAYPEYAIEVSRYRSFIDCPMKQSAKDLAEAGFFYTGLEDRVNCFHCGGGLKDWNPNDIPWHQHAFYLSDCNYVRLVKGQKYIDSILNKHKTTPTTPPPPTMPQTTNTVAATTSESPKDKLCKICYNNEYNTTFLPCGHVVACTKCATSVTKCPLCRKPFDAIVRVYFS